MRRYATLFGAVIIVALSMLVVRTYVGLGSDQPEATKQRAWALVSLIVSGFVGYIAGQSTGKGSIVRTIDLIRKDVRVRCFAFSGNNPMRRLDRRSFGRFLP